MFIVCHICSVKVSYGANRQKRLTWFYSILWSLLYWGYDLGTLIIFYALGINRPKKPKGKWGMLALSEIMAFPAYPPGDSEASHFPVIFSFGNKIIRQKTWDKTIGIYKSCWK